MASDRRNEARNPRSRRLAIIVYAPVGGSCSAAALLSRSSMAKSGGGTEKNVMGPRGLLRTPYHSNFSRALGVAVSYPSCYLYLHVSCDLI